MRKLKLFALFITLPLISCERDDICAATTQTTPRLLIEFYDSANTDDLKNVPRLTVYGENLITNPTEDSDTTLVFNQNKNLIELPLKIESEDETTITLTRFVLEKETNLRVDDDNSTESNIDKIEISYQTEFVFVSKACGYKSIFNNLDINLDLDGNTWIDNIEIVETTIENENTTHVKIFH